MSSIIPGSTGPVSVMTGPSHSPSTQPMPGVELSSTSPVNNSDVAEFREWATSADLSNASNLRSASRAPSLPVGEGPSVAMGFDAIKAKGGTLYKQTREVSEL